MYDVSRSISTSLPFREEDIARWHHRSANSLTIDIPAGIVVDLSQLNRFEGLRHLHIGGDSRKTVVLDDVLSGLTTLESLAVNLHKYTMARFPPRLRELRCTPFPIGVDLSGLNLRSLWVDGLRGHSDLTWLSDASVKTLVIQHAPSLSSLAGIPRGLGALRVDFAPHLSDLDALAGPCLRSIELHRCGSPSLVPVLVTCLVELLINECGAIPTISVLVNAQALRRLEFYGSTRVQDGRIAFLGLLPSLADVRFQDRKEYDSTREEIWTRLGARLQDDGSA
mgnify:CR=1 FL=1